MNPFLYVLVEFLSADEGGRKGPIYLNGGWNGTGGYSPHFRVIGDTEYLGVQFIEGPDKVINPKEKVAAKVRLLYYPNVSYENLTEGKEFEILEGPKVVGMGRVIGPVSKDELYSFTVERQY